MRKYERERSDRHGGKKKGGKEEKERETLQTACMPRTSQVLVFFPIK
jgi:hypothetical protein